jgi:hypothetical protein
MARMQGVQNSVALKLVKLVAAAASNALSRSETQKLPVELLPESFKHSI